MQKEKQDPGKEVVRRGAGREREFLRGRELLTRRAKGERIFETK